MSTSYQLTIQNDSADDGYACVYLADPDLGVANVYSTVWLSENVLSHGSTIFTWTTEYDFTCGQVDGGLAPGVVFDALQTLPADLSTSNEVTLTFQGIWQLVDQRQGPESGKLYIHEDASVPILDGAVGIGMSGAATFVTDAMLNTDLVFTPHPGGYWIAFGDNYQQGLALDTNAMTDAAEIIFPPDVYSVTATRNGDGSWTIEPD